jgi:predicted 2-oxoglutarate/Fe(II)-dependent dioxygenase YbiX
MAFQSVWFMTDLPKDVIDIIERDTMNTSVSHSMTVGDIVDTSVRHSQNSWIPSTHWIGGFLYSYVLKANRENFLYDLRCIDNENLQYTQYSEGMYYHWHNDAGIKNFRKPVTVGDDANGLPHDFIQENTEQVRKLSFSLQLSDPDDYVGGNLQLLDEDGKSYIAPRIKGSLILFDSRTQHRVTKIKEGTRKSIVGWVVGPRWR